MYPLALWTISDSCQLSINWKAKMISIFCFQFNFYHTYTTMFSHYVDKFFFPSLRFFSSFLTNSRKTLKMNKQTEKPYRISDMFITVEIRYILELWKMGTDIASFFPWYNVWKANEGLGRWFSEISEEKDCCNFQNINKPLNTFPLESSFIILWYSNLSYFLF